MQTSVAGGAEVTRVHEIAEVLDEFGQLVESAL